MSDVVVQCEALGKRYQIGEWERYRALRDSLIDQVEPAAHVARDDMVRQLPNRLCCDRAKDRLRLLERDRVRGPSPKTLQTLACWRPSAHPG